LVVGSRLDSHNTSKGNSCQDAGKNWQNVCYNHCLNRLSS
jgi:hypothetical protein